MNDPSTLSFVLVYAGTLGVAVLMFLGQVIALTALLVLSGAIRFQAGTPSVTTGRRSW